MRHNKTMHAEQRAASLKVVTSLAAARLRVALCRPFIDGKKRFETILAMYLFGDHHQLKIFPAFWQFKFHHFFPPLALRASTL